jgi:hypothetical protein
VIGPPPSYAPAAFVAEGKPLTTRVSLVTRNDDGAAAGLDAATGTWVSLDLPSNDAASAELGGVLALSPSGRFVASAPVTDGGRDDYVVVDLETARIRTFRLPFGVASGGDPFAPSEVSRDSAVAVLDDGTLALIRLNNQAFFLVSPDGVKRELTSLGDVRSVTAQPHGRFLLHRNGPVTPGGLDETGPRIDLLDAKTGKVVVAATDLGASWVAAVVDPGAGSLAWRRDATGEQLVSLMGRSGRTVQESTWSSRGGVESLWPSEQGTLVGLGWSPLAPNSLLRADSGVDGSTGLRPLAAVEIDQAVTDHGTLRPQLLVAGSVVAQAELVDPPSQPWWGRFTWRAMDLL